jgi:ATP-dependent DNA ligase
MPRRRRICESWLRRIAVRPRAAHELGQRTPRKNEASRWNAGKDLSFVPLKPERVVEVRYDYMEGERFRHTGQFNQWRPDPATHDHAPTPKLERPVTFSLNDIISGLGPSVA